MSSLVCRITRCHSSCAKQTTCKYLLNFLKIFIPSMSDHEMSLIMCQANNLQSPLFLSSVILSMSGHEMSLIMCQVNSLQIPLSFSKVSSSVCRVTRCHSSCAKWQVLQTNNLQIPFNFSQNSHLQCVGLRDVTKKRYITTYSYQYR